jgi:hypothetical protein
MLGLSGLAQTALAALPATEQQVTPVPVFRNLSWHQPYALIGARVSSPIGSVIRTGVKSYFVVPQKCNIVGMMLVADQVGSLVVDIYRTSFAQFPPTEGSSITFGSRPTLSNAQSIEDRALINWSTTLNRGDVLAINVLSCTKITNFSLALLVERA